VLALLDVARIDSPISGAPLPTKREEAVQSLRWRAAEGASGNAAPWQIRALTTYGERAGLRANVSSNLIFGVEKHWNLEL